MLGHCRQVLAPPAIDDITVEGYRSIGDASIPVRYDQLGIELHSETQAVAGLAGSKGAVEGEHPRLKLLEDQAADGTGHPGGVDPLLSVLMQDIDQAFRLFQGFFYRLHQPGLVFSWVQPVDDHIDIMLLVAVEFYLLVRPLDLAVQPHPGIALGVQILEKLAIGSFLLADDWGEDGDHSSVLPFHLFSPLSSLRLLAFDLFQDADGDPLRRLRLDAGSMLRAVGDAYSGKEQAEVVVDLCHRSHGAAGVFGGGLLLDGDGWGEAVDGVHIGLVHLA